VNTLDEMKSYELKEFTGSKDSNTESQIAGIPNDQWEVKAVDDNLDDSMGFVHEEGSDLMGDKEKAGIVQKVLLMTHFNQET
jgi:hypothetical protein